MPMGITWYKVRECVNTFLLIGDNWISVKAFSDYTGSSRFDFFMLLLELSSSAELMLIIIFIKKVDTYYQSSILN